MNIKLKLIILHLNIATATSGCLLENQQFISRLLLNNSIESGLRDILLEYITMRVDWVNFTLLDVIPEDEDVVLYYCCLIPSMLENKKGEWINLGEINDTKVKKLAFQASQKVAI